MLRIVRIVLVLAAGLLLAARPAPAVDITGSWSVCLAGIPTFGCPDLLTGRLESASDHFSIEFSISGLSCVVTGPVNPTTGAMNADPGGCPYVGGLSATATDTLITGTFSFLLCPSYTFTAVKACPTCADANGCTVDGCGATACSAPGSSCTYVPTSTGSCDDGDPCTSGDTCTEGTCTGTSTTCNDNNPCTDDACAPLTGQCTFTPNTNPCYDGSACTTNDTCSGGTCVSGPPLGCAPCERCGPLAGCIVGPRSGCRQAVKPARTRLTLGDAPNDGNDKVIWTWGAGAQTSAGDYGNPVGGDDYTLCIFDGPPAWPRLVLDARAPAGGTCATGGSCWSARGTPPGSTGFLYKDSGILLPDGLNLVRLTPGAAGKAKATARGKGAHLGVPSPMNVTLPVTVQLQGENGACLEAVYMSARTNRETLFRAIGGP
jgi:hypothetical protein